MIADASCRRLSFFLHMATDRDTLIFQKAGDSATKDLYSDFGIKTTSVPLFVPMETKELPSRDWADEDGEDVYFPETAKLKAYDTEVSVVYHGSQGTFQAKQESLFNYFRTGGTEINIFSPYSQTGCKGAYFQGFADINLESDSNLGDVATFKLKFRITKPGELFIIR